MSGLRILHVTPYSEHAWAYGGIPRVVGELSRGLTARGHQVTVCATDACDAQHRLPESVTRDGEADGLRIFANVSNAAAYHLQLFLPVGLSSWLREHARDFDVAHIHACHNLPGAIAARQLRRAGVPFVLSPHGTGPRIERRLLAKWLFDRLFARRTLEDPGRVLAVSECERRDLAALGVPDHKLAVLGNPVEPQAAGAPARGAFRRRNQLPWRDIVLFLGKLTPRKRVDRLVHAFAALRRQDAGLVIAGNDMGAGASLHRLVERLGIASHTRFLGLLTGGGRMEALTDADVVAYPSEHEVFGLVAMEALQCGTPVVVAADSGCGELVRWLGGGRVVSGTGTGELSDALRAVLDDRSQFARAAQAAARQVSDRFSRASVCTQLERHYLEVIGS